MNISSYIAKWHNFKVKTSYYFAIFVNRLMVLLYLKIIILKFILEIEKKKKYVIRRIYSEVLIAYRQRDKDPPTRILNKEILDCRIDSAKGICVRPWPKERKSRWRGVKDIPRGNMQKGGRRRWNKCFSLSSIARRQATWWE